MRIALPGLVRLFATSFEPPRDGRGTSMNDSPYARGPDTGAWATKSAIPITIRQCMQPGRLGCRGAGPLCGCQGALAMMVSNVARPSSPSVKCRNCADAEAEGPLDGQRPTRSTSSVTVHAMASSSYSKCTKRPSTS